MHSSICIKMITKITKIKKIDVSSANRATLISTNRVFLSITYVYDDYDLTLFA